LNSLIPEIYPSATEAVPKISFWGDKLCLSGFFGLAEKPGRTLARFDRVFQELAH
jgi:hypothetical protein